MSYNQKNQRTRRLEEERQGENRKYLGSLKRHLSVSKMGEQSHRAKRISRYPLHLAKGMRTLIREVKRSFWVKVFPTNIVGQVLWRGLDMIRSKNIKPIKTDIRKAQVTYQLTINLEYLILTTCLEVEFKANYICQQQYQVVSYIQNH